MSTVMSFWGVEVKSGEPLKISPDDYKVVHISQASLGEAKKEKESKPVCLYLKVDDKKLVLGTLSAQKFPQLSFDLVIEKDFELSHNWKYGSVYFTGYKLRMHEESDDDDSDADAKEIQLVSNGAHELHDQSVTGKPSVVDPSASTSKQKKKDVKAKQKAADDSDSDDSDLNVSSADDDENPDMLNRTTGSDESSEELDDSDDEEDDEDTDESESDDEEQTPKKAGSNKKRPVESASNSHVPDKKAKFITPQKTEGRKGISHIATPHPSKKSGKTPASSDQTKQQPKKSGGSFLCKSCNRSFTTGGGLESHTKAKHSGPA